MYVKVLWELDRTDLDLASVAPATAVAATAGRSTNSPADMELLDMAEVLDMAGSLDTAELLDMVGSLGTVELLDTIQEVMEEDLEAAIITELEYPEAMGNK